MSKRVYRSWMPMTKRLAPAPYDRRKRLTLNEAKKIRRQWNARTLRSVPA